MVRRAHIAVLLLAVCLGGCGGYTMFDPESTGGLSYSGASATAQNPRPTTGSADRRDAATLNTLFASAADDRAALPVAKPVALASTGDVSGQPARPPAKDTVEPRGRAYLFRGVAGLIYSRGMDSLADRIRRTGVPASVQTYLTWRGAAEQAVADYRRDPAPIILMGHSMGGDSALALAERLNGENIPVSLLVTYDPSRIADDVRQTWSVTSISFNHRTSWAAATSCKAPGFTAITRASI
jgi:hypothetical protein